MTARRSDNAGVTLIEMLVVLAVFAVVAGAVALSLPDTRRATSADAAARALAAHLDRAVDLALTTNTGFGIAHDGTDISFVQRARDNRWVTHSDNRLAQVKLSPRLSRISVNAQEVYSVTADLIPDSSMPFRAVFGSGAGARVLVFDGAVVHLHARP